MAWFNVDDSFYDHPKVFDAPDCAVALWTRAGSWSSRNLTDGFVPAKMPARLCDDHETAVRELLDRGLWKRTRGGYLFHDWQDWNRTREQVQRKRSQDAERQRRHRAAANGHSVTADVTRDKRCDSPVTHPSVTASNPIQSNPLVDVVSQISDRYARVLDDDDLLKTVIDEIHAKTRRTISGAEARAIAASILAASKRHVSDPSAYVAKAIRDEKDPAGRWLDTPSGPVQPPLLLSLPLPPGKQHPFKPDSNGTCESCGLPENNRHHLEAS